MTEPEKVFVRFRGRTLGPLTSEKVVDLVRRGSITRMHELSSDGLNWTKAEDFGDYFHAGTTQSQPVSNELTATTMASGVSDASLAVTSPTAPADPRVEWFAHINDQSVGPMSAAERESKKNGGRVTANTLVWRSGFDAWQTAQQAIPELFPASVTSPQNAGADATAGRYDAIPTGTAGGHTSLAVGVAEMTRQRGWILFTSASLIIFSVLQILLQIIGLFVVAKSDASHNFTPSEIFVGIFAIIFATIVLTGGILLLQYSSALAKIEREGSPNAVTSTIRKLNAVWSFAGIAMLFVVILALIGIIAFFSQFLALVR